mmetsp:Transcript_16082/g.60854  ORF Transcript_16082/g.60854 Transcript_16082/m.60854 type:complete len:363 (+) Transcript_16082:703-1791(+)
MAARHLQPAAMIVARAGLHSPFRGGSEADTQPASVGHSPCCRAWAARWLTPFQALGRTPEPASPSQAGAASRCRPHTGAGPPFRSLRPRRPQTTAKMPARSQCDGRGASTVSRPAPAPLSGHRLSFHGMPPRDRWHTPPSRRNRALRRLQGSIPRESASPTLPGPAWPQRGNTRPHYIPPRLWRPEALRTRQQPSQRGPTSRGRVADDRPQRPRQLAPKARSARSARSARAGLATPWLFDRLARAVEPTRLAGWLRARLRRCARAARALGCQEQRMPCSSHCTRMGIREEPTGALLGESQASADIQPGDTPELGTQQARLAVSASDIAVRVAARRLQQLEHTRAWNVRQLVDSGTNLEPGER